MSARIYISNSQFQIVPRTCAAFVGSVMDLEKWDFSQQSKRNFLYFATINNSTMDYLLKVIKDRMVGSPPSCNQIHLTIYLPSCLKERLRSTMRILSLAAKTRSYQKNYNLMPSSIQSIVVKVSS